MFEMESKDNFDIYVGGKSGVFKGVKIDEKECRMENIQTLISITANDEVTAMSWGNNEEEEILIACGKKEIRSIKVYDTECSMFTCSLFANVGTGMITGISRYNEAILTAVQSGEVKLWRLEEENGIVLNAGENLDRMRHSKINKNIIATGGNEHEVQLFDLQRQQQTFRGKNVRHDWLELRVPIWISDIDFLPNSEQVATVGRYGHIRLYDPKAQKRPVINLEKKNEAWSTLSVTPREKQIIVGSGKGRMNLVDLRKPAKILNTYKGFVGGVTGIACSTVDPYVVSVSLDRHLRVHHIDTKQLLKNIYLTSKISCMLLRSGVSLALQSETNEGDVQTRASNNENLAIGGENVQNDNDREYDMLFENMQVVTSKRDKKLSEGKRKQLRMKSSLNKDTECDMVSYKASLKRVNYKHSKEGCKTLKLSNCNS